jgi:group I intron endonuclease
MLGIYCYIDKQTKHIVYIGKDSHIDKNKRHKDHHINSNYNKQPLNSVLQNNPNRYSYHILDYDVQDENALNELEMMYIKHLNPKFNFTKGGDGVLGLRHSESTKEKLRNANIGKKLSSETKKKISEANTGENHPMYGRHHSEETKERLRNLNKGQIPWNKGKTDVYSKETLKRMSNARKGKTPWMKGKHHSDETKEKISQSKKGVNHSQNSKIKMSKGRNTTGYYNVSTRKDKTCKQGFTYLYRYFGEDGKRKTIYATDIAKLEEKVKAKGLKWFKFEREEEQ